MHFCCVVYPEILDVFTIFCTIMSDWRKFQQRMKEKRLKKGVKEAACSKKEFETIVVQRLSAEVTGKAQKYSRVGAREFVSFEEFGELTIQNIKDACMKHFRINDGMTCDVLAGEQGPSCTSIRQLPSFKVIHVRFVDEEATVEIPASTAEPYLAEPLSKKKKLPQRVGSPPTSHISARIESAASPSKFVP